MKKYIGIIKIEEEHMGSLHIKFISKTYDDISLIYKWFSLYPNYSHVVLENNFNLDMIFNEFLDLTPVTEEEINMMNDIEKSLKKLKRIDL